MSKAINYKVIMQSLALAFLLSGQVIFRSSNQSVNSFIKCFFCPFHTTIECVDDRNVNKIIYSDKRVFQS